MVSIIACQYIRYDAKVLTKNEFGMPNIRNDIPMLKYLMDDALFLNEMSLIQYYSHKNHSQK